MPPEAKGDADADPRMALTQIAWPADIDAIHMLLNSVSDPDPEIRIGCAYTLVGSDWRSARETRQSTEN